MDRMKCFEGMPHPYDRKKRMVIPHCLKVLRLRPERKFCKLADLSKEFGWKHKDLIERLEGQRKVKSGAYFAKKKATVKARNDAIKNAKVSKEDKQVIIVNTATFESIAKAVEKPKEPTNMTMDQYRQLFMASSTLA